MIDLHCHLLPGIDDGPLDVDEAVAMARAHVASGVRTVVATPHVTWETPNRADDIKRAVESLRWRLMNDGIPLEIRTGGEVALSRAIDTDDAELTALHLGLGPWLLLELPLGVRVPGVEHLVGALQDRGHRILLAHPERCPTFHGDPDVLARMVAAGALAQGTTSSLTGSFGRPVQRLLERYVSDGLIHVMASDAHDCDRRPPGLVDPIVRCGYPVELATWWCQDVPQALLKGAAVPVAPELSAAAPETRRWWRRRRSEPAVGSPGDPAG